MIVLPYKNLLPNIDKSSFIACNATIVGDVTVGKNSGIWYGCVARGDVEKVIIGDYTNIQDNTVIHTTRPHHIQNKTGDKGAPTIVGSYVTVGHSAIIHACTVQDYAFIGMGSIIMDMAVVEEFGMLAAGATLTTKKVVKSGELWAGSPAKFFRLLTDEEKEYIKISAQNYAELAQEHKTHITK